MIWAPAARAVKDGTGGTATVREPCGVRILLSWHEVRGVMVFALGSIRPLECPPAAPTVEPDPAVWVVPADAACSVEFGPASSDELPHPTATNAAVAARRPAVHATAERGGLIV
jgi:hypothetical protein